LYFNCRGRAGILKLFRGTEEPIGGAGRRPYNAFI